MAKKALTLHMEDDIIDDFRNYCKLNAMKLSAKVELLLKKEMETAHSNPTLVKLFEDILKKQTLKGASQVLQQEKIQEEIQNQPHPIESRPEQQPPEQIPKSQENQESSRPKKVPSIEHLRRVKGI